MRRSKTSSNYPLENIKFLKKYFFRKFYKINHYFNAHSFTRNQLIKYLTNESEILVKKIFVKQNLLNLFDLSLGRGGTISLFILKFKKFFLPNKFYIRFLKKLDSAKKLYSLDQSIFLKQYIKYSTKKEPRHHVKKMRLYLFILKNREKSVVLYKNSVFLNTITIIFIKIKSIFRNSFKNFLIFIRVKIIYKKLKQNIKNKIY
jgi:hypothetical protein